MKTDPEIPYRLGSRLSTLIQSDISDSQRRVPREDANNAQVSIQQHFGVFLLVSSLLDLDSDKRLLGRIVAHLQCGNIGRACFWCPGIDNAGLTNGDALCLSLLVIEYSLEQGSV